MAKLFGVRVYKFSLGFPPKMIGFKKGETEYCISWIPLGGYVKMAGENPEEGEKLGSDDPGNLMNKSAWQKALIFASGPLANYLTAIIIASGLFLYHGREVVDNERVVIGQVEEGSPADRIGMRQGDVIRSIGDTQVSQLTDVQETVFSNPGEDFNIVWERNGRTHSASITTLSDTTQNIKGEQVIYGRIGIRQATDTLSVGIGEAFVLANKATWNVTVLMVGFIQKLVTGEASTKMLGGPIAIAKFSGEKAREGLTSLMDFIVLISINLAILNLLPIPVLDGGHLFLLGVEVIRRKPLTLKQKAIFQQIGLAFLLVLIVLVTYNDIFRNLGN